MTEAESAAADLVDRVTAETVAAGEVPPGAAFLARITAAVAAALSECDAYAEPGALTGDELAHLERAGAAGPALAQYRAERNGQAR